MSGLRWSAGAKFGAQVVLWTNTLLVMRILDARDYGLVAMATAFVGLCELVNEGGMGAAIVHTRSLTDRVLRQVFGLVLATNLAIFLLLALAAPAVAAFFGEPRLRKIVWLLALQFPVFSFFVIPNACLDRAMDFRRKAIVEFIAVLASSFSMLGMALGGFGVWSLVVSTLVLCVVRAVGLNLIHPYLRMPLFDFRGFGALAKFGGYVSLERVLWYFYSQADVFIVGRVLGATALGFYAVAMRLASLPLEKIASLLHQVGFPAYARIQDDPVRAGRYTLMVTRLVSCAVFPIFFGLSAVAPDLILGVLDEKWAAAVVPMQLLSLVLPLRTLNVALAPALKGMGRPDIAVKTLIGACVIMPAAFAIGTLGGVAGVGLAWIVGYTFWFLLFLPMSLRPLALDVTSYLRAMAGALVAAVPMYALVEGTRHAMRALGAGPLATLPVLVGVGALAYGGLIWVFRRSVFREFRDFVRT